MSNTENDAIEDLTKINGKSVDAIGHVVFKMDFDHFKSPFCVQKVFGLVDKKTNGVFKFKLVVNEDGPREIKFKLVYVSEEHIDCQVKIASGPSEILENRFRVRYFPTTIALMTNFHFPKGIATFKDVINSPVKQP